MIEVGHSARDAENLAKQICGCSTHEQWRAKEERRAKYEKLAKEFAPEARGHAHHEAERAALVAENERLREALERFEPIAYAPRGHIARYLTIQNHACWVYSGPTAADNEMLYRKTAIPT